MRVVEYCVTRVGSVIHGNKLSQTIHIDDM